MSEPFGEKQHEATPLRRQQAREQGHVVKSHDLSSAALLLAGLIALLSVGRPIVECLGRIAERHLGGPAWLNVDATSLAAAWNATAWELAGSLAPLLGALLASAVAASLLQTGWLFLPARAAPDFRRLNPLAGLAMIFSAWGLLRLGFGMAKLLVAAGVAFYCLYARRGELLGLTSLSVPQLAAYLVDLLLWTAVKIAAALLVLAGLDYLVQRFKFERDLRMTTQELREELKQTQGSPETAQRRRALRKVG
jgi:flagellar biosynthetic protein FlhB